MTPEQAKVDDTTKMPGVRYEVRPDGLAFLIFDRPDAKVNLLSGSIVAALEILLGEIALDRNVRGLVLVSAKPASFIAGADITEIGSLRSRHRAKFDVAHLFQRRLFPSQIRLPAVWQTYYDRWVETVCIPNGKRHDLKYAY